VHARSARASPSLFWKLGRDTSCRQFACSLVHHPSTSRAPTNPHSTLIVPSLTRSHMQYTLGVRRICSSLCGREATSRRRRGHRIAEDSFTKSTRQLSFRGLGFDFDFDALAHSSLTGFTSESCDWPRSRAFIRADKSTEDMARRKTKCCNIRLGGRRNTL
jgi:hypothetical protein